jgi:hypothetical protein
MMERIGALLSGLAMPFVYLYMVVRMLIALPGLVKLSFKMRSLRIIAISLGNIMVAVSMLAVSLIHFVIVPVFFVLGLFMSAMGEIGGTFAFALSCGFGLALWLDPTNDFDFFAITFVFAACTAMASVALIVWASTGEDYDDEQD